MAYVSGKSGSFTFSGGGFTFRLNWSEDYDVGNNTSIVQIDSMEVMSSSYIGTWYPCGTVKINGETVCDLNYYSPSTHTVTINGTGIYYKVNAHNNGKVYPWKSGAISHNADGSKLITISVVTNPAGHDVTSIQMFRSSDSKLVKLGTSYSTSVSLTTIARASQPSLVTWPDSTANVGDFGEEFAIHMNSASQDFRHTVRYEYGDRTGTIESNVINGTTWAVPLSFMNDIPSATSASGRIYVDTYHNGTKIGTKYTGFTVTVPASVKPSCTATLDDTTGVDGTYGSPVQNLSKIKVTVNPTQAYSSPIASYSISIDGVKYSSQTATTGFLNKAGDSVVTVTVTDKRGRTSDPWKYTMNVQAYNPPSVSYLSVHRCDADGNEDDQGEYVEAAFGATVTSLNSKNTAAYKLRYKKSGTTTWTTVNLSVSGYEVESTEIFEADVESSYDVELVITDRHKTTTHATSVSTAFTLMDWHYSGTGIRFGGVSEEAHTFRNDLWLQQTANRYAFSSVGTSGTAGYIRMARIELTSTNADSVMTFEFTRRRASTPMTVHVRFQDAASVDPELESIVYEGANYGAFLVKTATSTWDLFVQKSPTTDTITLQDWYTSYRQMKRVNVTFPGDQVSTVPQGLVGYYRATPAQLQSILDYVYPVGSIYLSYSHVSPADLFGGTWVRIENAFLWATTPGGTIGQTGGESTHTLTVNEMPSHVGHLSANDSNWNGTGGLFMEKSVMTVHGTTGRGWTLQAGNEVVPAGNSVGGGAAHNNMPPYIQVSIWRRTA